MKTSEILLKFYKTIFILNILVPTELLRFLITEMILIICNYCPFIIYIEILLKKQLEIKLFYPWAFLF